MKSVVLLMALLGMVLSQKSFPEETNPKNHKVMSPVEGEANGKNGHPTDVTTAYERFIKLAAEVNADDSLEPEEKKRRLGAIHDQLTKLIHSVTGVPKELISNKLPHPEAEALRQEFLKEVDNAFKSTSMSTEERKAAIGVARTQFRQSLDEAKGASKEGAKHQTHKQMEKTLQSRARADVMSKMKHIMNDASLTQEDRKEQFNQEMKKEIHRLQQQYRRQDGGQPSTAGHHKKTKPVSRK